MAVTRPEANSAQIRTGINSGMLACSETCSLLL